MWKCRDVETDPLLHGSNQQLFEDSPTTAQGPSVHAMGSVAQCDVSFQNSAPTEAGLPYCQSLLGYFLPLPIAVEIALGMYQDVGELRGTRTQDGP